MSSKLNAIMTPRESVALSKWSGYVYAINDTITSLDYCGGECYFRKNDPCHFYAIHENTCYFVSRCKATAYCIPAKRCRMATDLNDWYMQW